LLITYKQPPDSLSVALTSLRESNRNQSPVGDVCATERDGKPIVFVAGSAGALSTRCDY
jgi:hypothetical protein